MCLTMKVWNPATSRRHNRVCSVIAKDNDKTANVLAPLPPPAPPAAKPYQKFDLCPIQLQFTVCSS
jgi:hypothetical protein